VLVRESLQALWARLHAMDCECAASLSCVSPWGPLCAIADAAPALQLRAGADLCINGAEVLW